MLPAGRVVLLGMAGVYKINTCRFVLDDAAACLPVLAYAADEHSASGELVAGNFEFVSLQGANIGAPDPDALPRSSSRPVASERYDAYLACPPGPPPRKKEVR